MVPSTNGSGMGDRTTLEIDAEALASSPLKVPARPWTSVAGDGIVSNLISSFFKWDDSYLYSFVDRELFLRDMRSGVESQYCSPLLVNSICAARSVSRLRSPPSQWTLPDGLTHAAAVLG